MARLSDLPLAGRALRRIRGLGHATAAFAAIAILALTAVLGGNALTAGAGTSTGATVTHAAAAPLAGHAELPAAAEALARDATPADTVRAAGSLLSGQIPTSARALARLGGEGRLLAVVLSGLLLALVGRRPLTRRPVLVPIPVSAAPGLRARRRGPPPR